MKGDHETQGKSLDSVENSITMEQFLENRDLTELGLDIKFLGMKWSPNKADQSAACELHSELLTRITTQALRANRGEEKTALAAIYSLYPTTREIIQRYGKECINFSQIAILVLKHIVRPFTAKWQRASLTVGFDKPEQCREFRDDFSCLQIKLIKYARLLADIAGMEDMTLRRQGPLAKP